MTRSTWLELLGTPFEQRWVNADGVSTRALVTGQGDPLLLLHGIGGHAEAYTRNLAAHGQYFTTYAIDMIGHGYTDAPDVQYGINTFVEHIRAFLDAEGIERAALSGESLGGWVAAKFALRYPQRVSRLVLNTSAGYWYSGEVASRIKSLTVAAVKEASFDTVRARLEWLMKDPGSVTDELVEIRLAIYGGTPFGQRVEQVLHLLTPENGEKDAITSEEWKSISIPTLVLWTTHDPSAPVECAQEINSLLPHGELTIMSDCGHWPQFEAPDVFNARHLRFLRAG